MEKEEIISKLIGEGIVTVTLSIDTDTSAAEKYKDEVREAYGEDADGFLDDLRDAVIEAAKDYVDDFLWDDANEESGRCTSIFYPVGEEEDDDLVF